MIDSEDAELVLPFRWNCSSGYAVRHAPTTKEGNRPQIRLYRLIIGAKPGEEVDHINRDRLDNRKKNLRICTRTENARNRSVDYNSKSGVRGVTLFKQSGKWRADIRVHGELHYLGLFETKKGAAKARKEAEMRLWTN